MTDISLNIVTSGLGGDALLPGTAEFDKRRALWNGMIDRVPLAIVAVRDVDSIRRAIDVATRAALPVCIKGGGHNIAGTAVADQALMIDMSALNSVEVDPRMRTARVGGGATWAEVDAAAQRHGLAAPGGVVSSTGVAGLTLGGGFGWLARLHGLAIDNLLSCEIVLADGRVLVCSETQNTDLFWAIRGGSGNFGVVSEFVFRLHPVGPQVLFGPTFFALDDARDVLAAYCEQAPGLPREACAWANLMTAPAVPVLPDDLHGTKVLTLMQFYGGSPESGYATLERLYGGIEPLGSALAPRPFVDAQSFMDPAYAFGARNYWRTHNHTTLTPQLIDTLVDLAPSMPTPDSELLICLLGGAVADVAQDATAFPHRNIPFISTPGVRWHDPAQDAEMIDWIKAASARIAEHAPPGSYVNFIAETDAPAANAYGPNLDRLSAVKRTHDPHNLFRSNQNIAPRAAADTGR